MRSLIFFSSNPQETSALLEAAHDDLFCKAVLSDPAELLERLYRDTPDVLLLDLPQDDSSAAELLFAVCTLPLEYPPLLFLLADRPLPITPPEEVVCCLQKPIELPMLISRIRMFSDLPAIPKRTNRLYDRVCSDMLLTLGVSPHLQGFEMLRHGAMYLLKSDAAADIRIMYELYPAVAKATGTNVSIVEHAMRHAIEVAWMRADLNALDAFFGYTTRDNKPTPSNSAFLFTLAERVRMRLNGISTDSIAKELRRYEG